MVLLWQCSFGWQLKNLENKFRMKDYDHKKIEKKVQLGWEKKKIYQAKDGKGKKFYSLIEFPYPSGDGLHVGHPRPYIGMDVISRKRRMEGFNVLYPIGWDAFGLPTENRAIDTGIHPKIVTKKNTDNFTKQIKSLGISFDWSREINTTDPKYYKWTQWIFLQFFKKGLAYKAKSYINWCPKDKIGLANEEAVGGICDRCGSATEKREKEQWMLAITKYADRLDKDLDLVDYPERVKSQQRNWIGKSEGSEISFKILTSSNFSSLRPSPEYRGGTLGKLKIERSSDFFVKVFTTRADTLFGVTYVVLAPEHPLVEKLLGQVENKKEVEDYIQKVKKESELERTREDKEKTGVELKGIKAINPTNEEVVPVWIADYVLVNYGTGAVMAVPEHDKRDREFSEKFNLPIIDRPLVDAKEITKKVDGEIVTKFKLRDWVFSRQRYWGEPIPIINCEKCGLVPVPEKDLPVKLPEVKSYKPTDNGESPLASISKWVNVKCPKCKGKAKRETDTMPNWAGSSWYYLRYTDPKNAKEFASKKNLKYWTPVDWYNGGMEHTTLHLLYSRFWHKFLYDLKLVPTSEPYKKRTSHGMILGEGGVKMSKSLGNVVNPDDIVKTYGADTLRVYEMFMGPFEESVAWSTESIIGSRRFIERVWNMQYKVQKNKKYTEFEIEKTIKKVSEDIEGMKFNTAISTLMIFTNEIGKLETISQIAYEKFLKILSPFAPHITEEIWQKLGKVGPSEKGRPSLSIHLSSWPKWDENLVKDQEIKIAIQINGKVRAELIIGALDNEEEVKTKALSNETVLKYLAGGQPKRVIYVKGRVINILN